MPIYNECNSLPCRTVLLFVETGTIPRFTTLLQNGLYTTAPQGSSIGEFLVALPGFSKEYVDRSVQTIFLNGLPADSLHQQLFGKEAVLAISAAMPGLAGAIFRKCGQHASLRSKTAEDLTSTDIPLSPVCVHLKLFNVIARERGRQLLEHGCKVSANSFKKFLQYHPPLLLAIRKLVIDGTETNTTQLEKIPATETSIELTLRENDEEQ